MSKRMRLSDAEVKMVMNYRKEIKAGLKKKPKPSMIGFILYDLYYNKIRGSYYTFNGVGFIKVKNSGDAVYGFSDGITGVYWYLDKNEEFPLKVQFHDSVPIIAVSYDYEYFKKHNSQITDIFTEEVRKKII